MRAASVLPAPAKTTSSSQCRRPRCARAMIGAASVRSWSCSGAAQPSLHIPGAAVHLAFVGLDDELPGEIPVAGETGVSSRAAGDGAGDAASGFEPLAVQNTEDDVTARIGPHGAADA